MKYCHLFLLILLSYTLSSQGINKKKVDVVHSVINNINWPEKKDGFIIQVITSDRALATEFRNMAGNRQAGALPIKVGFKGYVTVPQNVDVLYLTAKYEQTLPTVIEKIGKKPVLVITEQSSNQQFVMVNLLSSSGDVSFEYNPANIANQDLTLGDGFRGLGGKELNLAQLYQETRTSVEELNKSTASTKATIDSLSVMTAVAFKVGRNLMNQVTENQAKLDALDKSLDSLSFLLGQTEDQIVVLEDEIAVQKEKVKEGRNKLVEQSFLIEERNEFFSEREDELSGLQLVIAYQTEILLFLIAFAVLFVVGVFLAYRAYKIKMRDAKLLNEQKEELDEMLERLQLAQDQLVKAERMAVVGEITESFANDIGNALNYVYSGIHIVRKRIAENKEIMANIAGLDEHDSDLKMKVKVREIVQQKEEFEYDSYEEVVNTMINSILIGADRVANILKDLKPYSNYTELGKMGLSLLGRDVGSDYYGKKSGVRQLPYQPKKRKSIPKST